MSSQTTQNSLSLQTLIIGSGIQNFSPAPYLYNQIPVTVTGSTATLSVGIANTLNIYLISGVSVATTLTLPSIVTNQQIIIKIFDSVGIALLNNIIILPNESDTIISAANSGIINVNYGIATFTSIGTNSWMYESITV